MKFYKIRHVPTGMYYQPTKGCGSDKTNLSKNGKVYQTKPSLKHLDHGYRRIIKGETRYQNKSIRLPFVKSEWEIVEFEVIEKVVEE